MSIQELVRNPVRVVRRVVVGFDGYDPEMVLEAAANALDRYGWEVGRMGDKRLGFCAVGAIRHSAANSRVAEQAVGILGAYLNGDGTEAAVMSWNDSHWRYSGHENVTNTMRTAAHLRRKEQA